MTYEEYFEAQPSRETELVRPSGGLLGKSRKDTTYENFVASNTSKYIFENDLLDQSYKFWENPEDKEERLRKIWFDLKRKNALGGLEQRT